MKNKKAFTLVELLIVIAVIAIMFILILSKVNFATDKAKDSGVLTDFRSYQIGIQHIIREDSSCVEKDIADLSITLNKNLDKKMQFKLVGEEYRSNALNPYGYSYVLQKNNGQIKVFSIKNQGDIEVLQQSNMSVYADETDSKVYSAGKVLVFGIDDRDWVERKIEESDGKFDKQTKQENIEISKVTWDKYEINNEVTYTGETYTNGIILVESGYVNGYSSISVNQVTGEITPVGFLGKLYLPIQKTTNKGEYFEKDGLIYKYSNVAADWGTILWFNGNRLAAVGVEIQSKGALVNTVKGNDGEYPDDGIQDGYWYVKK